MIRLSALLALTLAVRPASAGWLESGLEALAGNLGMRPAIGAVERAPGGGVLLRRVELTRPGLSVSLPEVRLSLDWKALMKRRFQIVQLDIPELDIEGDSSFSPPSSSPDSAWSVAAHSIRIGVLRGRWTDGGKSHSGSAKGLHLAYADGRLEVREGRLFVAGSTAGVSGSMLLDGTAADLTAEFSGRLAGRLRLVRKASVWVAEGRPSWDGLPLEGKATLAQDGNWTARVSVADMGRRAPAWTKRFGVVRGQASASGRGLDARSRGQAQLKMTSTKGLSAAGSANWKEGAQSGSGTVSGLGIAGNFSWAVGSGKSTVSWSLAGATVDLSPVGVDLRIASAAVRGSAERRTSAWQIAAEALAEGSRARGAAIDRTSIRVQGGTQAHTVQLVVETMGTTVSAMGEGRWVAGAWKTRWDIAELMESTGAARGEAVLSYAHERIDLGGSVMGLDLGRLPVLASMPVSLGGELVAKVALSGHPRDLAGEVSWSVSDAMVAGIGPGTIQGGGTVSSGTIVLRESRWESGRAWATLSGSAPFPSALAMPDYDLLLGVGGMEESPLSISEDWMQAEDLTANARMRVRRTGGKVMSEGTADVRAAAVRFPASGVSIVDATAAVVADGASFRVSGHAKGQNGSDVNVSGRIGTLGPELTFNAKRLAFSPRPGTKAEASLACSLSGAWSAPRLTGEVVVARADIGPPPRPGALRRWFRRMRGKSAPPPAKPGPAFPPHLAADLKVSFDRQVWYKEGATSVELRGALRVRREPPADPQIYGHIETLRGRLVYYGRTFELQSSRLDFFGKWPPDPEVEAQALYVEERSRTRVSLSLSGPLSSPRATLSSEPPLEERDILSVLAIGRPLDDRPERGETSAGREAAENTVMAYASQSVRQNLFGSLNLDVFQLRLDGERRSHLTVGRYVSRDLFLSSEKSFGQGGQHSVKAEYTLSPHWSVELARTSLGYSVIDLYLRKGFF